MRTETFSYLPPMTRDQVRAQIRYALERGLIPAIEFTSRPGNRYWNMWRLPLFGAPEPLGVLAEIDACAAQHPDCWVRIVGYDPTHGGMGTAFVIVGPGGPEGSGPTGPHP